MDNSLKNVSNYILINNSVVIPAGRVAVQRISSSGENSEEYAYEAKSEL
jgi:hypothetical protein